VPKHLFSLPENIIYLNGAYISAQLLSVGKIGMKNLHKKATSFIIYEADFFSEKIIIKQRFAQLIDAPDPECFAMIPYVSSGVAIAVKKIPFQKSDEIILPEEQFPGNYCSWKQLEKETGVVLKIIKAPSLAGTRAKR
jgi:selenocysteine lyase/cysteine desulfurase